MRGAVRPREIELTDDAAIAKFWSKVDKTSSCWNWAGSLSHGYGKFRDIRAHRYSYELHNGKIPDGLFVCHRCDNPKCVNPEHLFVGDAGENAADRTIKGRSVKTLSVADCAAIKDAATKAWFTPWWAAEKYGITKRHVNRILSGGTRAVC